MTRSFFQSLEKKGVRYLLISGQAAVMYGASFFSEDIDVWVEPSFENWELFIACLASVGARYYKLTPPMQPGFVTKGHGFHFTVGSDSDDVFFLDVMGVPPRATDFREALSNSIRMPSAFGDVQVVGVRELVELKKTQRLQDYDVISRLVVARMTMTEKTVTEADAVWALQNVCGIDALAELAGMFPYNYVENMNDCDPLLECLGIMINGSEPDEKMLSDAESFLQSRIAGWRTEDRLYWRPIIAELKQLRSAGGLMREGELVLDVPA